MTKPISQMLREAAEALEQQSASVSASGTAHPPPVLHPPSSGTPPDRGGGARSEVLRLFAPYNSRGTATKRPSIPGPPSSKKQKKHTYTHRFFCLSKRKERDVPSPCQKTSLERVGLGEKRIAFPDKYCTAQDFSDYVLRNFPQLKDCGGFQLLRSRGSSRSKVLEIITCPDDGYTPEYLASESVMVGQALIYIRPLQKDVDLKNLQNDSSTSSGPLIECMYCTGKYNLSSIDDHIDVCENRLEERDSVRCEDSSSARQEGTAGTVAESSSERQDMATTSVAIGSSTSHCPSQEPAIEEWKTEPDIETAARMFRRHMLKNSEQKLELVAMLDSTSCEQDRERDIIIFYKRQNIDWTSPFNARLKGDAAMGDGVTRHFFSMVMEKLHLGFDLDLDNCGKTIFFNGEEDHKVPSTSRVLMDGDLFRVVGRMIGHTFIHGGPLFTGLSLSFFPLLSGNKEDTPVLELKDCPDIDVVDVVSLLESQSDLSQQDKENVNNLAISWDLPPVSNSNRRWLAETILHYGVIGRREKQIAQMRRGLKETGVLRMIKERPELTAVLFPRSAAQVLEPEMLLRKIIWPEPDSDEDEDRLKLEETCQVTGFLREYIETGCSTELRELLQFWTGWTVPPEHLYVEMSPELSLPVASTCFTTLKLPLTCTTFPAFVQNMRAAVKSTKFGFGLV